ncbi:MEMAR_RS02690 family S-layer glycoprotein [Methanoculleus oceani]|uniref:PGF-CTERM sorting domain-containing protein n=1 Tax=Methanoculleus oceani TaxID=2184756 RepID=A0ABD4TEQ1_9EURY|nr:MEMAR_RS02690 family S-layer glycoprotein [Methanoculleus sp. CWC-02]MCM2465546.1 PGF-CTERM sorting domain-containing protein [Methanoculleus sp. CWC-02]
MKSMTKLMIVAMVLVAALVVAPAAARTIDTSGTVIYVGEENLNFDLGVEVTSLSHFSGESEDNVIIVGTPFNLNAVDVDGVFGTYYVNGVLTGDSVIIRNPSVVLDVMLAQEGKTAAELRESVNSRTVTRTNDVVFKLTNNLIGFTQSTDVVAGTNNINIDVTLPGGGVTRQLAGVGLANIVANGTTFYSDEVALQNLEAGTYTAQAKWPSAADFYGKGFDSNTVTFELATKTLAITANKDNVVRGNSFTVTITGESLKTYYLFIREVGGLAEEEYPFIVAGQSGVADAPTITGASPVAANVTTNAGGTRSVQFNTNTTTDDRQYTIRVQDPVTNSTYDEVKVRVEQGDVTITASGTGVYYIGEEVTLSGTSTDNDTVFLFLTGPNLNSNGVMLTGMLDAVINGDASSFDTADVESDDTWSLKWNTGDIERSLDAGGYTIYAASRPVDKAHLSDAKYATASVQLRSGFITATSSGAVVAKGDDLTLTGTAQGDPGTVAVWVFGKNKQILAESATVEDDGSFEYDIDNTETFSAGQYFVVIQHPMMDKIFGIEPGTGDEEGWIVGADGSGFTAVNIARLQASDAATALITALDSPNIDDTYVKLTFVVEEAQIFIDAIGDKAAGSTFTITGTTNLAVGDTLNIEVTSAAFQPTSKSEASGFGSVAGVTEVQQGDGVNTWSFEVDGSSFKPDQYIVNVESIETDTTTTATFNVVEAVPTTQATPTTTATGEVTPTTTATTAATPTQSPGFGALIALAGLGAVAFLVLRRD